MRRSLSSEILSFLKHPLAMLLVVGLAGCRASRPPEPVDSAPIPNSSPASTWFYQLQNIEYETLLSTDSKLLVIDPSRGGDGDSAGFWRQSEIRALSSQGKVVLSYLSVGEAEEYRDYWQRGWNDSPPDFLHNANPDYTNNHLVRYWDPEWKSLMLQRVERDVAGGFDGIYLDKVDAVEDWLEADPSLDPAMLRREMVQLVSELRSAGVACAEKRNSQFLVYLQNSGDLWQEPGLAGMIDGIALEEYSLGWENKDGQKTPANIRSEMTNHLKDAHEAGVSTLVVDYPNSTTGPDLRAAALDEARRLGALPLLAPRDLDGTRQ